MRMYVDFDTNLPDTDPEKGMTMQVENVTFTTPDGYEVSVGCSGWSDFGVDDGHYGARYKGLEFQVEDPDGNEIHTWEDDAPSDEILRKLENARITGILFYWEEGEDNVPEGLNPSCENLEVTLLGVFSNGEEFEYDKYRVDKVNPDYLPD